MPLGLSLLLMQQAATQFKSLPTHDIFSWIGQIAATLTAVGVIYKFLVRPLILAVKKITSMYEKVEGLVAQFERNGGSSFRDSIDRIERTVTLQDSRQRILLGLVPYSVTETDDKGKLIFCNRVFLQWTGRLEDEVQGDGWVNVVHPDDRERLRREWDEAVVEKRAYEARWRMIDIHGRDFYVFCRCFPMVDGIDIDTGTHNVYGWFAVIYKCDGDVCLKNPELCPFAIASGTCKGGDHSHPLLVPVPRAQVHMVK